MSQGYFISFEGGEGCGKSTQAKRLFAAFEAAGKPALLTREPGGTPEAESIRNLLITGGVERWVAMAELLMFQAARVEHVEKVIRPALAEGRIVITDRYVDSTRAYQGLAKQQGLEVVDALHRLSTQSFMPALTIWLDVPPEIGLARTQGRPGAESRFERHGLAFHEALRDAYRELARLEPARFVRLDATEAEDALHEQILRLVSERCA